MVRKEEVGNRRAAIQFLFSYLLTSLIFPFSDFLTSFLSPISILDFFSSEMYNLLVMSRDTLIKQLNKKKAFIFDMDGTIIDLEELNHKGYADTIKKSFDIELTNEDYQKYFSGTRTADAFNGFLKSKSVSDYEVEELIKDFRDGKRYNLKNNPDEVVFLKRGVVAFLENLKKGGLATCLATSTVKEFVDIILGHFDLNKFLDVVLTADDVTKGKPDPQIYNIAIDRLDVKKDEAVVFEDSKNGIDSAKNAGILCVGIWTKGLNDEFVKKADFVVEDYKKIGDLKFSTNI